MSTEQRSERRWKRSAQRLRSGARRIRRGRFVAVLAALGLAGTLALVNAGPAGATTPTTIRVAVANNAFAPMLDPNVAAAWVAGLAGSTPEPAAFTHDVAGQAGGFWRADDSTTLRGITSGNLRKQIISPGPYTAPGAACSSPTAACVYGPASSTAHSPSTVPMNVDLFLSADENNPLAVIPTADGGTCTTGTGNGQGGENVTECPGDPNSLTEFAIGNLAIYSCNSTWDGVGDSPGTPGHPAGSDANNSGNGAPNSPACNATPIPSAPTTMAGVVTWLNASASHQISIANPSSAPFGVASVSALDNAGFTVVMSGAGQNAFPSGSGAGHCEAEGTACKVRLESGITQVRGAVTSGTDQLGLLALSSVKNVSWTSGTSGTGLTVPSDDPNNFTPVPSTAYDNPIGEYGVVINYPGQTADQATLANEFLQYLTSPDVQDVLANYGYSPLS